MEPEKLPKDRPEWFIVRRPHWLPQRLSWRHVRLLAVPVLVAALVLTWYIQGGWRHWYTNHTPGTVNGDGAVAIATDHTTYLGDEPLAITVTNHLLVPIYTQITPNNPTVRVGTPCSIDLYAEVLNGAGRWVGFGALGVGAGCDWPCMGTAPRTPPPEVQAIAPGVSYTQHWHPSIYEPTTPAGTYRIVFRYSTDPAAAKHTYVGEPGRPGDGLPETVGLTTANSAPVRVVDGLHPAPVHCVAA